MFLSFKELKDKRIKNIENSGCGGVGKKGGGVIEYIPKTWND